MPLRRPEPARPRPDVKILDLRPTGGSAGVVTFAAEGANYGTQQCRAEFVAHVGDERVECSPHHLDLLTNAEPSRIAIAVPRPRLGELVHERNHATTLYGKVLQLEVMLDGIARDSRQWRED